LEAAVVYQKIALVVDDEQEIVDGIQDVLRNELSFLVLPATDPAIAVDLARHYHFDLVVLDLQMPKLDGLKVLELLRKRQPHIRAVVITGLYDKFRDQLETVHVDQVIKKPFQLSVLKEKILDVAKAVDETRSRGEVDIIPKAKILLVDDAREQSDYLRSFLKDDTPNEYEVEIAGSGEEGIEKVNDFSPDLVLFDLQMPRMTGEEMMSHIQNGQGSKPRRYIVISANTISETVERIQALGCPYVAKPFHVEELLQLVRRECKNLGLLRRS
jgi:CheY-like chemotaxis protein